MTVYDHIKRTYQGEYDFMNQVLTKHVEMFLSLPLADRTGDPGSRQVVLPVGQVNPMSQIFHLYDRYQVSPSTHLRKWCVTPYVRNKLFMKLRGPRL